MILPHTETQTAGRIAETIRERVAALGTPTGNDRNAVTMSIGIASGVPPVGDIEGFLSRLIETADQAMYVVKERGGDGCTSRS